METDFLLNDQDCLTFVNCFICLEPVPPNNINDETIGLINFLFGYLKIEDKLNSFVCVKCGDNLTKFVKLCGCEILEKVRLEMDYLLGYIKSAILNSNKVFKPAADELTRVREAVVKKCGEKICSKPEIILERVDWKLIKTSDCSDEWLGNCDDLDGPTPFYNEVKIETKIDLEDDPNWNVSSHKFTCTKCFKSFASKISLKVHNDSVHLRLKPFKCSVCPTTFARACDLRSHFKVVHVRLKAYKCDICYLSFAHSWSLRIHKATCHNAKVKRLRSFPCGDCDHIASSKWNLERHRERNHQTEKVNCHICLKQFSSIALVDLHMKNVHTSKRFKCSDCSYKTKFKHDLKRHKKKHEDQGLTCEICSRTFASIDSFNEHVSATFGTRTLHCQVNGCNKTYGNYCSLSLHYKDHPDFSLGDSNKYSVSTNGDSVAECKFCGKKFKTVKLVKSHINTVHEQRKYKCQDCNFAAPQKSRLESHIKRMHFDNVKLERIHLDARSAPAILDEVNDIIPAKAGNPDAHLLPYKCEVCAKSFKSIPSLNNHKRVVHQGKRKRYPCDICKKEFVSPSNLQVHFNSVHKKERHYCQVESCGKDYSRPDVLLNHYRLEHPDLVPEQVKPEKQKKTTSNSKLDDKRHHCQAPGCYKSYLEASNLLYHYNTKHANEVVKDSNCDKFTFITQLGVSLVMCMFCKSSFKSVEEVEGHIERMHSAS